MCVFNIFKPLRKTLKNCGPDKTPRPSFNLHSSDEKKKIRNAFNAIAQGQGD